MNYCVYSHTSPSGKIYIGITGGKPEIRWANGLGYQKQTYFWNSINKYGWNSFLHEIIKDKLTKEEAAQLEIELIKEYKALNISYNISDGGDGCEGYIPTQETIRKMAQAGIRQALSRWDRIRIPQILEAAEVPERYYIDEF